MAVFPSREHADFMSHWETILSEGKALTQTILWDEAIAGNVVCYPRSSDWLIGYWLGRAFWGRGIATQALERFIASLDQRPLLAYVLASNVGSVRVLEKCGFTPAPSDSADDDELLYKLLK